MRMRVAVALLALALPGCGKRDDALTVENVRVRLPATAGGQAAAYFTIKGGAQPDRLLSVASDVNLRTELHESMKAGGMTTMKPLDGVDIPARATVRFAPGGRHAMLFGLQAGIKPYETIGLTFTFQSGTRLSVAAPTRGAGDIL